MSKQEKTTVQPEDAVFEASKRYVTETKSWATQVREAWLAPWERVTAGNEVATTMVEPWIAMTRLAHDRVLDTFEAQSHELLDRTQQLVRQAQTLQQPH